MGLAQGRVGRMAHVEGLQGRGAQHPVGQIEEMRQHLAHEAAFLPERQPFRLGLPRPRPDREMLADVDAEQGAELAVPVGRFDDFAGARRAIGEIDRLGQAGGLHALSEAPAVGDVDAERLLAQHRLAGVDRGQRVAGMGHGRHADIDEVGLVGADECLGRRVEIHGRVQGLGMGARGGRGVPAADDLELLMKRQVTQHALAHDAQAQNGDAIGHVLSLQIAWPAHQPLDQAHWKL